MKNMEMLEDNIKCVLNDESQKISVSEDLKSNIDMEIKKRQLGEVYNMKRFNIKKIAIVAACVCMLTGTVCLAAGKITSYVSSSGAYRINAYNKLNTLEDKVNFDSSYLEKFSNGYTFASADLTNTKGLDENNNKVKEFKELDLEYGKGQNSICLSVCKSENYEADTTSNKESVQYEGITLYYMQQHYKFEPEGYQLTDKDKEEIANGNLEVSYGSSKDKESKQLFSDVDWEQDGVHYLLFGSNLNMEKEDLIAMAKEVIDAQ